MVPAVRHVPTLTAVRLEDIPTPALLIDVDRLDRNLEWMANRCRELHVALRPHIKTHKSPDIGRRQLAQGAAGITVSTIAEAEAFVNAGFEDITWAFPVIPQRINDVAILSERARIGVVVDTEFAVDRLAKHGAAFAVWLKVDCGYHRAGVDPASDLPLAIIDRIQQCPTLAFRGLLSHSGHAYDATEHTEREAIAETERDVMTHLGARVRAAGTAEKFELSVGSTPSMRSVASLDGVDEARPGNYALFDLYQAHLGTCTRAEIAVTVFSTVISSQPGRSHSILDAGGLSFSKDPGVNDPDRPCYGEIVDDYAAGSVRNDAWVTGLSQEHGKVNARLPVGSRVRVYPNHSCVTVAEHDVAFAVQGDTVVDEWPIHRRRSLTG